MGNERLRKSQQNLAATKHEFTACETLAAVEERAAALLNDELSELLPPFDRTKLSLRSRTSAPQPIQRTSTTSRVEISAEMRRYMAGEAPLPKEFVGKVFTKIFEREPDETDPEYAKKVNRTFYKIGADRRDLIRRTYGTELSLQVIADKLGLTVSEVELQRIYNQGVLKLAEHLNISLNL